MYRLFVLGVFAVLVAFAAWFLPWPAAVGFAVLAAAILATRTILTLRALGRLRDARRRFDSAAMLSETERLLQRAGIDPKTHEALRFERGIALLMAERYEEAKQLYASLDVDELSERNRIAREVNLAWCELNLGRPEVALAEMERLATLLEARGEPLEGPHRGLLGAAYVRTGKASEALGLLEEAATSAADFPPLAAMHRYFLGEAFRALGREKESRAAFEQAARDGTETPYGRRAQRELRS